jgi:hypothetical protein
MRRVTCVPAIVMCAALLGCAGKESRDGGGITPPPPPPVPTVQCSDSPPAVDQVVLRCGARVSPAVWEIDVVVGYDTTSTDINGFAFQILIDPTVLAYIPGSAKSGSMLFQGGVSSPLLTAEIKPGDPGRLVVGIYRTEGASGVQGKAPPYDRIMVFQVKALDGAQFDPDPPRLRFDKTRSEALDSSVPAQTIPSITFSDQILLSRQ